MKRFSVVVIVIMASAYFALICLQLSIVAFSHLKPSPQDAGYEKAKAVNQCPPEEYFHFNPIEMMGTSLVRVEDIGWKYNPGVNGNPKGYLGDCFPYRKSDDVFRIVFLGDSFTGALAVSNEESFVKRVEKILNGRPHAKKIEAINLGVGGYGTDQEYFTLLHEAAKYKPDLIVHCIFLGNDIRDNSNALFRSCEWPQFRPYPIKRYLTIDRNGSFVYHKPDLDFYYEINLAAILVNRNWSLHLPEGNFTANFTYGGGKNSLSGDIRGSEIREFIDSIDRFVFFKDGCPVSLHLKNRNTWLNAATVATNRLSGTINNRKEQIWSAGLAAKQPERWQRKLKTMLGGFLNRHLLLQDLRTFVKKRLVRNYVIARFLLKTRLITSKDMPAFYLLGFQGDYIADYKIYLRRSDDPEWENAWNVTLKIIEAMRAYTEQNLNARYVVFTFPAMESVYPDYWEMAQAAYPALRKDAPFMDVTIPTRRMERFLAGRNIPHLSFFESLADDYKTTGNKLYSLEDAHFNAAGHAFVANRMSNFLLQNGLLGRSGLAE